MIVINCNNNNNNNNDNNNNNNTNNNNDNKISSNSDNIETTTLATIQNKIRYSEIIILKTCCHNRLKN